MLLKNLLRKRNKHVLAGCWNPCTNGLKLRKNKYAYLLVNTDMEIATLKSLVNPVNDTTTDQTFINDIFNSFKNLNDLSICTFWVHCHKGKISRFCDICNHTVTSNNGWSLHINSKMHRLNTAQKEDQSLQRFILPNEVQSWSGFTHPHTQRIETYYESLLTYAEEQLVWSTQR